jgi:hypothetical protein
LPAQRSIKGCYDEKNNAEAERGDATQYEMLQQFDPENCHQLDAQAAANQHRLPKKRRDCGYHTGKPALTRIGKLLKKRR